jgi:soluble lytic murein transglycosylase
MKVSRALVASAAVALAAAGACAQPTAPGDNGLPPGLIRQGGVVMMQPIPDSEESGPSSGSEFGGERRATLVAYLSPSDHEIFSRAVEAAKRGDWADARAIAGQGRDPIARRIIEWGYLIDRNSGAPFAEIAQFLTDYPGWPGPDTLLARAEEAIPPTMDPRAIIVWFGDRAPKTGMGKVRLGEALIATGEAARGRDIIRDAWIEDNFEPEQELYVVAQHADALTPEANRERLEHLFARNDIEGVQRELPRVVPDVQRVAGVRLLLRRYPDSGEREADGLPAPLRDDPGLLFDLAHLLRERSDAAAIPALLARAPTGELAKLDPARWWSEINADARMALEEGAYRSAFALAAAPGLPSDSSQYDDAQFLAGWIALRELKEPQTALAHFGNLLAGASHPISRARAHYWMARAYEAAGQLAAAWQGFHAAAENPATYYGQLALAHIETNPLLHVAATIVDADGVRAAYEREDLTQAIRALADLGLEGLLRDFALKDAELYPEAAHVKALAEDLTRMGFREAAVRVAKQASYGGIQLLAYSHPVISIPRYSGTGMPPENPFVLAIIRQETEFDPDAVSGAGARGLMQVMPDSAPHLAELSGFGYRFADLTRDPAYNMELGMTELSRELSEWGGSYVLAAAAYNAGPGNARKWIAAFGDPRDARVDPVDWIEEIPFSETRNYVQRVIENLEVYRNRLAGRDEPLQILADLYRPDAPQVGPLRYSSPAAPALPGGSQVVGPLKPASAEPTVRATGGMGIVPADGVTPRVKPSS